MKEIEGLKNGILPSGIEVKTKCLKDICENEASATSLKALLVASVKKEDKPETAEWLKWSREALNLPKDNSNRYEFHLLDIGNMLIGITDNPPIFKKLLSIGAEKNYELAKIFKKNGADRLIQFVSSPDRDPAKLSRDKLREEVNICLGKKVEDEEKSNETPDIPGLLEQIDEFFERNHDEFKQLKTCESFDKAKRFKAVAVGIELAEAGIERYWKDGSSFPITALETVKLSERYMEISKKIAGLISNSVEKAG